MGRRTLGLAVAAALLAAAPASAEPPRASCARSILDDDGDGRYSLSTTGDVRYPGDPSVDAIDLQSLTLRWTATAFEAHVKLKSLTGAFQRHETAYRYDVSFTAGDSTVVFQAMRTNPDYDATPLKATGASQYPKGSFSSGGNNTTNFADVHGDFDPATGWLVFSAPGAEVAKAFPDGVEAGKTTLTAVTASTYAYIPGSGAGAIRPADTASSTEAQRGTYTMGDEYCFGPPPASLTTTMAPPRVAYGDPVQLYATLRDEAGAPLAGKPVRFVVGTQPARSATTGPDGVARVTYTPAVVAGTYPLTVSFAGDATDGKATLTGISVTVLVERTRLAALAVTITSATARTVSTTLTDDDAKPLAGRAIAWYAGSKKVATTTTSSRGMATYKGAKAGQTIVAKFAGLSGKYAASATKSRKV